MADILIVDDEQGVRRAYSILLRAAGYTVREADSGREALTQMKEELPDVLLLDLLMPDGSGLDVLHVLFQRFDKDNIPPCVVLSDAVSAKERNELLALGVHTVIEKPAIPDDLLSAVASALEEQQFTQCI